MPRTSILFISVLLLATLTVAQESPAPEFHKEFSINPAERTRLLGPETGFNLMFQRRDLESEISFISAEMAGTGEVVTAAPYTATVITETTQVLADGNRIVNKNSAFVARDGQGRLRREETLPRIGPLSVDSPKLIFIHDPVAHTNATLDPGKQSAVIWKQPDSSPYKENLHIVTRRLDGPGKPATEGANNSRAEPPNIVTTRRLEGPGKVVVEGTVERIPLSEKNAKLEDLGTQTIEGVLAEGKRETITIPAGQVGNERPIEIVSESWFSPELHTIVLRKRSDPRSGESVYRLSDIRLGEPDASLFQVPSGYKIKSEPILEFKMTPPKE
jgi:hypothetical protein